MRKSLVPMTSHHRLAKWHRSVQPKAKPSVRSFSIWWIYGCCAVAIVGRLAYWQLYRHTDLAAAAQAQYRRTILHTGSRGVFSAADGTPIAVNARRYRLYVQPEQFLTTTDAIATQLCGTLTQLSTAAPATLQPDTMSSDSASTVAQNYCSRLSDRLHSSQARWLYLLNDLQPAVQASLSALKLKGVGFEPYEVREYPQASMSAQLLGFVGKDAEGMDIGYFGLEGGLEAELQGKTAKRSVLTDALGSQLEIASLPSQAAINGVDITLTIRRDVQKLIEDQLQKGMERYGGTSGEILVMEPSTGKLLGLANWPSFDPNRYYQFPPATYTNQSLSSLYEPGSTLKILTVAAGIDTGVITPETSCTKCSGPRQFGKYTIRTWNDAYNPGISMTDALAKSDNTAMMFVADRLGDDRLQEYLRKFGVGEKLGIPLQGDKNTLFPEKWGPVEVATRSFGQGISLTSLQLLRAVNVIANQGKLIRPRIIESVSPAGSINVPATDQPIIERQVISPATAQQVTTMMIAAAQHGEAQWTASKNFAVAGKTGTSQIASKGSYDDTKTIASFIGFSPPENSKYIMLVKIVEPTSSPWAAETAAPLWYTIAGKLNLLLNVPMVTPVPLPNVIE